MFEYVVHTKTPPIEGRHFDRGEVLSQDVYDRYEHQLQYHVARRAVREAPAEELPAQPDETDIVPPRIRAKAEPEVQPAAQ